jgi:hypothetical protein
METERVKDGVASVSLTTAELGHIYLGLCEVEQHGLAGQVGEVLDKMGVSSAELHDVVGNGPNLPRVIGEKAVRLGGIRADKLLSSEAMEELIQNLTPKPAVLATRRRRKRPRLA